jgi:hypothetical protein
MNRRSSLVLLAAGLLFIAGTARADTVYLKNGRRIEGKIVVDTDKEIAIEHQGTVMRFEKRYVAKIERDDETAPRPVEAPKPTAAPREDLSAKDADLPTGATDDEAERWRRLRKELRDAAQRVRSAQADLDAARARGKQDDISLAQERVSIANKALDKLRAGRLAIETAAKNRLATAERQAKVESDGLRSSLEAERARGDAAAISSIAADAHLKATKAVEEPRRRAFFDVESDAHAMAGDLLLASAKVGDRATMIAGARELVEAWTTADPASPLRVRHRTRAIEALSTAHRLTPRATSPSDVDLLLIEPLGFEALAQLVEESLDKRRFGGIVRDDESGRFKLELEDGRTVYSDEIPTNRFARVVWERRETDEPPPPPKPGEERVIGHARTQRWYELSWDPKLKLWARESEYVKVIGRLPAVAHDVAPIAEDFVRASGERVRVARDVAVQRDKLSRALRQYDEGTGSEDACTQAVQSRDQAEKTLAIVEARRAGFEKQVKDRRGEIEALIRAADKARKE